MEQKEQCPVCHGKGWLKARGEHCYICEDCGGCGYIVRVCEIEDDQDDMEK